MFAIVNKVKNNQVVAVKDKIQVSLKIIEIIVDLRDNLLIS
jgi:hypothetical protein